MSRKTIAPAVRAIIEHWPVPERYLARGGDDAVTAVRVRVQARRELRAILAVVRGAEKVRRYVQESGYGGLEGPADKAMFRALSRLSRLSSPKPRRGTKP